jgi:hypothetical protein
MKGLPASKATNDSIHSSQERKKVVATHVNRKIYLQTIFDWQQVVGLLGTSTPVIVMVQ